jgi:WD40 repeat protein
MALEIASISHVADLTPPALERTWLSAPHPTLPILATCGADKSVRIYSLLNFNLLSTISGGHKRSVRCCSWKPHVKGENVLATGSFDATAEIWRQWDRSRREEVGGQERRVDSTANVDDHAEERDDRDIDDGQDEDEWRFAVLLDGHDSEVKSVSWSCSGTLLATCSRDKSIWIWEDLDDGDNNFETVAVLQEHSADVKCVSWHPFETCLASASYDDSVRIWREDIDDWGQVACLKGHGGTVWYIDWEGESNVPSRGSSHDNLQGQRWREQHALSGPRIASCSDDRTIRVWRRRAKQQSSSSTMPSIIRSAGLDERWDEDALLPKAHDLSIYAVAWSKRTGLIASTGADGRIVIYEERFVPTPTSVASHNCSSGNMEPKDAQSTLTTEVDIQEEPCLPLTEWTIVAKLEAAHGIHEINHICWANRAHRKPLESSSSTSATNNKQEDEILISTADDGSIKVWAVER